MKRCIVFMTALAAVSIPRLSEAQASAKSVDCDADEMIVCAAPQAGGYSILLSRGRALSVCPSTKTGVSLRCFKATEVRAAERAAQQDITAHKRVECLKKGGQWVVRAEKPEGECKFPSAPPAAASAAPEPKPAPPGGKCTPDELARIRAELDRVEAEWQGGAADPDALREQVAEMYGQAVRCGDMGLAGRATALLYLLKKPEPPAPAAESAPAASPAPAAPAPIAEKGGWCGRNKFVCAVLIVGAAGAVAGATAGIILTQTRWHVTQGAR